MFNFFKKKNNFYEIDGVRINRSQKRVKTISLQVKNGIATINCPLFISDNYLRTLIKKKKAWIKKKITKNKLTKNKGLIIKDGANFPIFGSNFRIKTIQSNRESINIKSNIINLSYKSENRIKNLFIYWLKKKANSYLSQRTEIISRKVKIDYKAIYVKSYRARWGCCNYKSEIFLNWKLILLPKHIIDYVIIHELSHVIVPNHSKLFWTLVEKNDASFRVKKSWLKEKGHEIIKFN